MEMREIAAVEAVRTGMVTAHDRKAADRWRRRVMRAAAQREQVGLTGMALEHAVRSLAQTHPEYVVEESA
jgi:predicted kinase